MSNHERADMINGLCLAIEKAIDDASDELNSAEVVGCLAMVQSRWTLWIFDALPGLRDEAEECEEHTH